MKKIVVIAVSLFCSALAFGQRAGPFNLSAANQCAQIGVASDRSSTVAVNVSGTWSATLQPEVAIAGQSAVNAQVTPSTSTTAQATITSNGIYTAAVAGDDLFLVCVSAYTSGTAVVYLNVSTGIATNLLGGGGGSPVSLTATGPIVITPSPTTGTGVISCPTCGTTSALSGITAATAPNTIASSNFGLQIWNWAPTTNQNQIQFGETTAATSGTLGSQYIFSAKTLAGSTAVPLGVISSLTGSQILPTLHITPTWNTTGVVDAGLLLNVAHTASGTGSRLFDFQVNSTSEGFLDKLGNFVANGSVAAGTGQTACGTATGCITLTEGSTTTTPAASQDAFRADSTIHGFMMTLNNGAEFSSAMNLIKPSSATIAAGFNGAPAGSKCLQSSGITGLIIEAGSACGGGTIGLSSVTAATVNTVLANGNFNETWNGTVTTDSQAVFNVGETAAATSGTITNGFANQSVLKLSTASNSTASPFSVAQGSITNTVATPMVEFSTTWNNASLTGEGILVNVTNTASAAASLLVDMRVGNTAEFTVSPTGQINTGGATCTAGTGGGICATEGSSPTAASTSDQIYADSTNHMFEASQNNFANAASVKFFPLQVNSINTQTASYAMVPQDSAMLCNKATVMTITLLASAIPSGKTVIVKNIGVGACTVTPASGNIDGQTSVVLPQYSSISAVWDGTQWWIF